jgi:hypothetical protein
MLASVELLQPADIDDMFLTSNDSIQEVTKMLADANHRHPNIKLTSISENPTSFLDVHVKNMGNKFDYLCAS